MYNRKIKVSKKKSKSSGVTNGSNWGPRLALYEREQASQHVQKLSHPPPPPHHHNGHHHPGVGPSQSSNSSIYGHHYSQSKAPQQQQQHYNHYHHRQQTGRNDDPGPPGPSHTVSNGDNYYGSSSVASSSNLHNREINSNGSASKLSTSGPPPLIPSNGNNSSTNLSKPLSVIIPPPDRFNLNSDFGPDRDSSVPSTKTWRSSPDQFEDHHDNNEDYDPRHGIPPPPEFNVKSPPPPPPPSQNGKKMGKKISIYEQHNHREPEKVVKNGKYMKAKGNTKKDLDGPAQTKSSHYQSKGGIQDEEVNGESPEGKSKVNGATIAALAQGITMVYVPMEAASRNLKSKLRSSGGGGEGAKTCEQQAVENLQAKIDENKSCPNNTHPHSQNHPTHQQRNGLGPPPPPPPPPQNDESKDPDVDSLLESFDSVIFKPKTMHNGHQLNLPTNSNGGGSTDDKLKDSGEKMYTASSIVIPSRRKQQISEAPPLPPPNGSKPKKPDKNLRFSEQLENFQNSFEKIVKPRLGKKIPIPTTPDPLQHHHNHQHQHPGQGQGQGQSQQDTQSISTEVMMPDLKRTCHSSKNGSSEQSFHSTILSCGHMKTSSSYSTLSSITSTLTGDEETDNCTTRDPRTALEQLRDLSLLIGGNFHASSVNGNNPGQRNKLIEDVKNGGKNLKKDGKTRRDSEGSSGIDSGQGSGQSPTEEGKTSTNGSYPSSCAFSNKGDCEDCFMVFKNPLAVDNHTIMTSSGSCCSGSQSTGTSPAQSDPDRCESHHRHLIIHDQSRLMKGGGKNRGMMGQQNVDCGSSRSSHGGSKKSSKKSKKHKKSHDELVLEYCDCSQCDCEASRRDATKQQQQLLNISQKQQQENPFNPKMQGGCGHEHLLSNGNGTGHQQPSLVPPPPPHPNNNHNSNNNHGGEEQHHNGNQTTTNHCNRLSKRISGSTPTIPSETQQQHHNNNGNGMTATTNLFTIDEEEGDGPVTATDLDFKTTTITNQSKTFMDVSIKEFNHDEGKDHWHPKCWLASDPNMGWSDLESLYSQNMKLDKPISMNDECWTCWKDVAENRKNATNPNGTVDRTKRMFIWLNKRHKEFNAPWWEAKKQASIRWLVTKAFGHVPKEAIGDPFKESKKGKAKYRLKDEVIKGLVNGKLYCMALDHCGNISSVYSHQNQHYRSRGLSHWDIIKILSRRGVYVAQPSDMKLTEGTLRQKPLRIAAHIALIEAIMLLYCKEILNRDRIVATLNSFGQTIDPETNASAEQLLISWINSAMLTLKSYILSSKTQTQKMACGRLNRWLNIPQVNEIRDLCDGVGICSLFALYCSNDLQLEAIAVPEPDDMLNIYETIENHSLIERLCRELFPETVYHLCITDFLYIHGYMKQNILAFLVDLFHHLEINPIIRVNRLAHVPIRVEL